MLKQQIEESEIHFLTKKQFRTTVDSNPYIDKLHIYENNMSELIESLKYTHFDYVIDLHHNLRSGRIRRELNLPAFSFNKLNWEKWLLVNFKKNRLPELHIVDRYLATTSVFDIKDDEKGLDYFIPQSDEVDLKSLPAEFSNDYVGFVIGAQHATKKLTNEKAAEICSKLGRPVILLGGPDDQVNAQQIVEASNATILNTCGLYNLNQSASLVRQARAIISHDTGLMHVAAAFKKKIISVWGNTVPEFGMYPYRPGEGSFKAEVKDLKCRPCSKIGFSRCPRKHFDCMEKQDVDQIVAKVNELFN